MGHRPTTTQDAPRLRVRTHGYQPAKAEMEEDVCIDATPEAAPAALMRTVRIEKTDDA